jgi:hypothetical protein
MLTTQIQDTNLINDIMKDHKKIIDGYDKAKEIIKSCVNENHVSVARQVIDNLTVLCLNEHLPYDYYILYINNLKNNLKEKIKHLGIPE